MKNILLITADQLRYDCLGFQQRFPVKTPNIDALAAGGLAFNNAYCAGTMCVPSRASIMTGVHCFRHGVYYNDQSWPEPLPTLPGTLSQNGYYSVVLGKTGFQPRRRHGGFHKIMNRGDYLRSKKATRRSASKPDTWSKEKWDETVTNLYRRKWDESRTDIEDYEPIFHTSMALTELDSLAKRRQCTGIGQEPFFMWLSFERPHAPCCPSPPFNTMYRPADIPPPVRSESGQEDFAQPLRDFARGWECLTDELVADFRARYLGDVSVVDHQVGRVMQHLDRLGLRENTLIVFSSDHGDYLGDYGLQQKGFFHDCAACVPLIFNGPGVAAGKRVEENVSLVDLKPTLLDYCGLLLPSLTDSNGERLYPDYYCAAEDSMSLKLALQGDVISNDRVVICETGTYGQGIMAKCGNEKYSFYPQTEEIDYFDLAADPRELNNRGRSLTLNDLPVPVREIFTKVLQHTAPFQNRSYCYEGKIRPMFT